MVKTFALPALKLLVAGVLIFWLIDSGKLDIKQLEIFLTSWSVTITALIHFALVGVLLGACRLRLILRGLNMNLSLARVGVFQLIGLFFNVAMPGAVGGDLVKALYIIRENGNKDRTHVMMAILIDRISGMTGLFTIGVVAILFNFSSLRDNPLIFPTLVTVCVLFVVMIILHLLAVRKTSDENDLIFKALDLRVPGFLSLKKVYLSFREFRNAPKILLQAWVASVFIQLATLFYFAVITSALVPDFADWSGLATIFPIGVFTVAIPISPGGLGVGHIAFEHLYSLIGYEGGANVFNVYVLGYMFLCLTGALPYLTAKKKIAISDIEHLDDPLAEVGGG